MPFSQTSRRPHRPDSQTHSRGNTTVMKTKGQSVFFSAFYSGRAVPALLPASRGESCLYRAFPAVTATTTHAPSAWLALSHQGTPKPTATVHHQARPAHRHTYPNTRLPTINHYSGGLRGLLLQITLTAMTQQATTTPPAPFFLWHAKTPYSSASYSWHKIDPFNGCSTRGFFHMINLTELNSLLCSNL